MKQLNCNYEANYRFSEEFGAQQMHQLIVETLQTKLYGCSVQLRQLRY